MREDLIGQGDEKIAELVQNGQTEAFGVLIERYEDKIRRYARKFLSEGEDINDALQDIFIKVYKNIQSFDAKRRFSPWLYRIAHNELVNVIKKRNKNSLPFFDLDTIFPQYFSDNSLKSQIDNNDMGRLLDQCLNKLPPKYREPIILYYYEDLSYKEIADVMEIPVSTVGVRMKRAKDLVRPLCEKLTHF